MTESDTQLQSSGQSQAGLGAVIAHGAQTNKLEPSSGIELESRPDAGMHCTTDEIPKLKGLAFLDQLLFVWILLAMVIGILLGNFVDSVTVVLNQTTFVGVSLPLAIGLLVMMWPILCRVSYGSLTRVFTTPKIWWHLLFSLVINWLIAPFVMLALAWAFLPDREALRNGLILVGLARCIAMVMIWTDVALGDTDYAAVLVAFNSLLQMVLYAPLAKFFIIVIGDGDSDIDINYATVAKSVAVFLGIPLAAAIATRLLFIYVFRAKTFFRTRFLPIINPLSLVALLFTIIIIFAGQGKEVVRSITTVLRVMAPLIAYFIVMFFLTLLICRTALFRQKLGCTYELTVAHSFTAASNNFELAIAVAVTVYGAGSQQALATTVGPLVEVPVLLALAYGLVWFRRRYGWDSKASSKATPVSVLKEDIVAKEASEGDFKTSVSQV